jgi:GNAT superfamily N-acetyltransferase
MGLTPIPPGEVATVVTTLEMRTRAALRPLPESRLRLVEWKAPEPKKYRALFRRIGAPWLWFSRLVMDDTRLRSIIHDPDVAIFAAIDGAGIEVGFLELDFRKNAETEISYFGLIPDLAGQGHGRWLMAQALARGWRRETQRVWLHTCTLDHPSALNFYRAQGFEAIMRTIETFPDPRLSGVLPPDAAPQIPLLSPRSRR